MTCFQNLTSRFKGAIIVALCILGVFVWVLFLTIELAENTPTVEKYEVLATVESKRSETNVEYDFAMSSLLKIPMTKTEEEYYLTVMLDDENSSLIEVSVREDDYNRFNTGDWVSIEVTEESFKSGEKSYKYVLKD